MNATLGRLSKLSDTAILATSLLARLGFLFYGLYQDKYMEVPYTDIDYYVFTDAARFVANGASPYERATYRYTPLLSMLLVPTSWGGYWFQFGKVLFVLFDLVTGYLILLLLKRLKLNRLWSLIWFYNPMVITISTRGSSESLVTAIVVLAAYLIVIDEVLFAGWAIGLGIHLKLYPFIYLPAMLLFIDPSQPWKQPFTSDRLALLSAVMFSFGILTFTMYAGFGQEYIDQAFLYHMVRLDHRHNFSIYNLSLYFTTYTGKSTLQWLGSLTLEKLAFVPQLLLSSILVPLCLCYQNSDPSVLISTMFIQTFIFTAFNKVITSQYFVWFLCLLPLYVARTTIPVKRGLVLLGGWVLTQALWLFFAYRLEFKGDGNIFVYGIWTSSVLFFLWNCVTTIDFIRDIHLIRQQLTVKKTQ